MNPVIGAIVGYVLSDADANTINTRRIQNGDLANGNKVSVGDVFPLVITRTWGNTPSSAVNGQVLLDGNDTYWATSRTQGPGESHWLPITTPE